MREAGRSELVRFALAAALALLGSACATSQEKALAAELDANGFETRVDARGVTVLVSDVLFDFDSDALTETGSAAVGRIADVVARLAPTNPILCEGHTDAKGPDAYNFELSLRRARRVASALAKGGIDVARMRSQGYGESRPLVAETQADGSDDPEGRARNRRVEVVIASPQ